MGKLPRLWSHWTFASLLPEVNRPATLKFRKFCSFVGSWIYYRVEFKGKGLKVYLRDRAFASRVGPLWEIDCKNTKVLLASQCWRENEELLFNEHRSAS